MNHNLFTAIYNDFKVFNILLFFRCFLTLYTKQNLKKEKKNTITISTVFSTKKKLKLQIY